MKLSAWIFIFAALLVATGLVAGLYGNWLWFSSVGYSSVFATTLFAGIGLGLLFGLGFFAIGYINIAIAKKRAVKQKKTKKEYHEMDKFFVAILLVLAYFIGVAFSNWQTVLQFMN